jgi:hypothetical protein
MSDAPADTFAHYRVRIGGVWLHAVAAGTAEAVRSRLAAGDDVWLRAGVELLACKSVDEWNGPFPKGGGVRQWLVEVE